MANEITPSRSIRIIKTGSTLKISASGAPIITVTQEQEEAERFVINKLATLYPVFRPRIDQLQIGDVYLIKTRDNQHFERMQLTALDILTITEDRNNYTIVCPYLNDEVFVQEGWTIDERNRDNTYYKAYTDKFYVFNHKTSRRTYIRRSYTGDNIVSDIPISTINELNKVLTILDK